MIVTFSDLALMTGGICNFFKALAFVVAFAASNSFSVMNEYVGAVTFWPRRATLKILP
jgi:hypothetical protein